MYCWAINRPKAYRLNTTTVLFIHSHGLAVWIGSAGWLFAGINRVIHMAVLIRQPDWGRVSKTALCLTAGASHQLAGLLARMLAPAPRGPSPSRRLSQAPACGCLKAAFQSRVQMRQGLPASRLRTPTVSPLSLSIGPSP